MSCPARLAPVLLASLLGSACSAVTPSSPNPAEGSMPTRRILVNGVRVVVQEFHASDVVAVQLWVGVGARDEASSELGLAHYLDHMLFKGTVTRAPGFVEREVEGVGGRINAGTSLDYTYYHTVLPAPRAIPAVEMLADMSVNSTLSEKTLDLEKRVVLEEMRLGEDNPRRRLSRQLYELLFDGHPYGRPVIGTSELIQVLTRETLLGTRGGRRGDGHGATRAGEPGARRGTDPEGAPARARAWRDGRRAQARRDGGRGALRLLDRDRGGPRLRVRPRGDGVAPRGGARLRRSPPLGHARPDPLGGPPLPRSRTLRPAGVRAARAMTPGRSSAMLASLAALVAAAGIAVAQPPSVTRHVLPNGMAVVVRENPVAPVVTASLQVRAGSRFETAETAGITNFLVRTMIRGTARRSGTQVAETAEDIGGTLDASGEVESAEIRGEALARHWEELLGLIAEVALEPSLRGEEIERERRLVLSQIKTRAETPFSLSLDTLLRELYGSHPYAWHSLGLKSAVERLGHAQLAAHYRAVFRADRAVLAVSGQVSRERVVRAAERLFTKLPRSGPHEVGAAPPPAPSGERRVLERPAQQAQILAGYLGPGLNDPAYPAFRVLGAVLGAGQAGRLFAELREKRGLAYSLGALTPFRTGPSFLVPYLGTAAENSAAPAAGLLAELRQVRMAAVSDQRPGPA